MTEKRFTMADGEYNNPICYDYGNGLSYIDVMELLNALYEENQILKLRLEFIEAHNKALIHTNDELKKDLRKYDKLLELEYWREK